MVFSSKSTPCLTALTGTQLNFLLMPSKRNATVHDSLLPVLAWIRKQKMSEADFATKELGISHGRFTNWKRRGVPQGELSRVAAKIGKSTDQYLAEIGRPTGKGSRQGKLETATLIEDFEALPDFLQTYVARKTTALRALYDGFPDWFRKKLAPPKDPAQYKAWEREIEALMSQFGRDGRGTSMQ